MRAAYEEYLDGWDEHGAEWEHWVERSEATRAAFAGLLGASADDVAIQTSVSAAVSGLVTALRFGGERNRIVISENEFPTIGQIAHAQELRGAEVVQVEPEPEAYAAAVDERTALVCSTFVSYRTGAVHDVEAIYGIAREHGALMLVDAYQGVGALPARGGEGGDVVVGGTVKYLLASAGLAFMALRPGLVDGARADADRLVRGRERLRHADRALPAARECAPLRRRHAARAEHLRRARRRGPDRRSGRAGDPGARRAASSSVSSAGSTSSARRSRRAPGGPLVCIRSTDAPALVATLAADDIVTSERDSNLRVSLHLYNTEDDVDAVLAALARHRGCSPSSFAGSPAGRTSRAHSRRFQSGTGGSQASRGTKRERSTSCSLWM